MPDPKDPVILGIHRYLQRDKREKRLHLTFNDDEYNLIVACAKQANTFPATFIRAASCFAAALYHNAQNRKNDGQ